MYGWLDWTIEDNLPLSFCDQASARRYSKLGRVSSNTLVKYLEHTAAAVTNVLKEQLPRNFGILFDGWSDGYTSHYVAVYAVYYLLSSNA